MADSLCTPNKKDIRNPIASQPREQTSLPNPSRYYHGEWLIVTFCSFVQPHLT